ncbi:TIGR01777 family oxidoreductase [Edwardsiella tarda]|uniref:TIGR01777 family oxidoreductase n=1 Tax=Edwardsiella tarda TaxID=636 RepID=UPI0019689475|nr:TIGR01777 family oxidoreductase [Edwardsiella tarda]
MEILITGATGLIGSALCARLQILGHQLTALTRDVTRARQRLGEAVTLLSSLDTLSTLDGYDAVINLAGEPIADKRWSAAQKQRLCDSRWQITQRLASLIRASQRPPSVLLSGSAVGYYGNQDDTPLNEDDAPVDDFTHRLCARWEALAREAESEQTRVCLMRTGIVLAPHGGALGRMLPLFRLGLGGELGSGHQYLSWIHIDDMINAILYLLDNPTLHGPFNMTAPYPVRNEQFVATLGEVLGRPTLMRVPALALRALLGEASLMLLGGQRVLPRHLEEAGFGFRYYDLREALDDIVK